MNHSSSPAVVFPVFSRPPRKRPVALAASVATLVASLLLAAPERSSAASADWNAAPTNGNWVTGAENNWSTGAGTFPGSTAVLTSTDVATFNSASTTTAIVINSPTLNIGGITFTGTAANFAVGSTAGNALLMTNGSIVQIANTLTATNAIETVNAPMVIEGAGGSLTLANNSANGAGAGAGTLNSGGAISGGAAGNSTLVLTGTNTNANTVSGTISDGTATSLAVSKTGTGTWAVTGTNTYTGGTTVSAGTLAINNGQALGTGSVNVNSGATLLGTANLTFAGNTVVLDNATVAAATGTVMTLDSGNTGVVVMGPGNVTFGSAGNTGVVVIGNNAPGSTVLGSPTITVAFGTLRNGGGPGSPLSFFTANTLSTTVNAGARLDTNGFQTTINDLQGAGTLVNDGAALGTFAVRKGNFSGVIQDGTGVTALDKTTAGVLILTGANTYTGGTTITAGTLQIGNAGGATGSIVGNVVNNGSLVFDRDNIAFAGDISGTGSVTSNVTGTLTLTGTSSYTGGTTVNSGVLAINNGKALGDGAVNVINGSTLLGTATLTFTGNNIVLNDATVAAATGTVMTLDTGNTGTVTMGNGNVTFGSAGNTGVVVIGNNAPGSTVLGSPTITVAFGTLRNGGGPGSPLSFFTANTLSTTVNAGARLDTNGFQTTINDLQGAGALVNDGAALGTFNVREGNFSGVIQDGTGVTALQKTTAGVLILTGANTYTGGTTITAGTLQIGNAGGATGSIVGNVVNNAALVFDRDNIAFAGDISGTGSVTSNVTGTLTLTGTSSYTGGTTINSGTVAINNGKALGDGNVNVINGSTLLGTATLTFTGNTIVLNDATVAAAAGTVMTLNTGNTGTVVMGPGNVTFGSAGNTGVVVIGNNAPGSTVLATPTITVAFGTLRNGGGPTSPLSFFTANALSTTVNAGARLDTNGFQTTIADLQGAGTLLNDGAAQGTFNIRQGTFTGQIQDGAGVTALTKSTAGTLTFTGTANNTYTGPTNIEAGTVLLDTIATVNSGIRSAEINIGDGTGAAGSAILRNVGFTENISDVSAVTMQSDGLFDLNNLTETIGSLAGTAGQVTIGATATLVTGGNNTSTTYAGSITGGASSTLVKQGTGTWTLTSANAGFLGATTVAAGRLWAQDPDALGGAAAATTTITTGGILRTTGVLNLSTLNWGQGNLQLAPGAGTGDVFTINTAGGFQNAGGGGTYSLDPTGLTLGNTFTLTNYSGATNFVVGDFSAIGLTPDVKYIGIFTLTATEVQFTITGATASGNIIQNSAPVGTPTFADFTVTGPVTTGGPGENNTIKSLTFSPNSSLTIFNTLFVTDVQPVNLTSGSNLILGSPAQPQGNLSASQLNIASGSTLSGNGTIFGSVVNAGLVSPGYSPGTITITGNYTQTSSGRLRIEIGGTGDGEHDLLRVGGTAYLDGTLDLVRINRYRPKRGDKVTFLTAGQGVNGEFARVNSDFETGTILEGNVVYHEHSVTLEVVRGSFGDLADRYDLTPNQREVAGALDSLSHDDGNNRALVYLDERHLGALPDDFDRIAPEELSSIFSISTSGVTVQNTNLQRRTDDIRSGANGFSAAGLAINGQTPSYSGGIEFRTGAAGPTGGDSKESKEVKTTVVEEEKRWGAFLSGTGEWVDVDGDGNARGFDLSSGGFTLGLDYKVTPNFALGILAGYTGTTADLTGDGRVWVNGGKAGLYSTYFTGGFYLDAAVTGGYNSYDTKRDALQGTARGSTEGGELNALAGIGYDWKIGALTIGPTATFNYTLVGMDGFTEHGSLAPLDIDRRNAESIRSAVGFRASYDWKLGGVIIKPEVRAAWQHEYGDKSYDISASFADGGGDHFLVNGPEIGRDSMLVGAGFAIQFSESCSTYFYYDGELGRDRYDRNSVTGGVRVSF